MAAGVSDRDHDLLAFLLRAQQQRKHQQQLLEHQEMTAEAAAATNHASGGAAGESVSPLPRCPHADGATDTDSTVTGSITAAANPFANLITDKHIRDEVRMYETRYRKYGFDLDFEGVRIPKLQAQMSPAIRASIYHVTFRSSLQQQHEPGCSSAKNTEIFT